MRKIVIKYPWLFDIAIWERDSYHLHIFFFKIVKSGSKFEIESPDFKIRMRIKPILVKMPRVLKEVMDILRKKQ